MKTTQYFQFVKLRQDRKPIRDAWIQETIANPIHIEIQSDKRIRLWSKIKEAGNRYLRVVLLEDGETVHNAFFDRNFKEEDRYEN